MKNIYNLLTATFSKCLIIFFVFFSSIIQTNGQSTIWIENFTGGAIPAGWGTNDLTTLGSGSDWVFNSTAAYNSDGTPNGHIRIGQNAIFATDAVVTTADVAMTAGRTYKLQFKVRTSSTTANIPLEVRVGTGTGTLANYPTTVHTSTQSGVGFSTITTSDFTCLTSGNYKFAFRAQIPAGIAGRNIGIDNVIAIENAPAAMAFSSCTVAQASTAAVDRGSNDNAILNLQIVTTGAASPLNCTSITFNTTGTSAPADLTNAQLYYTGNSNTFSTSTPFGTIVTNPNGTHTVTGTQTLGGGNNNFWLAYNINSNATIGNVVDGQITSCTVGTPRTPSTTAPVGSRVILNDGPCGAVTLTPGSTCNTYTQTNTVSATSSGIANPSCGGDSGDDVWFKFTAASTTQFITVTGLGPAGGFLCTGSGYDPVVQILSATGICPSLSLTNIGCVDNTCQGSTENIVASGLTIGTTYYIRVYDYSSTANNNGFTICIVNSQANDVCANASTLTVNGSALAGNNTFATVESPLPVTTGCGSFPPTASDKGLWYTFTTSCAGTYTITAVANPGFDVEMAAFTGACGSTTGAGCGTLTGTGGTETIIINSAPANTTYRVLVWGYNGASGGFNISVTGPPPSLSLSNAGTPAAGIIPAGGTNQLLHAFTVTPACGATTYSLTSATVNNSGTAVASDFATNAKLYYDADNSGTVNIGDVLIASTPVSSVLTYNITTQTGISGTRRYIIVADVAITAAGGTTFIATSTAATANISVNAGTTNGNTRTISPFNDNCVGAFTFGTLSTTGCTSQTVVTAGATQTSVGCVGNADDDVWFSFTMPVGYTSIAYSNINISGNTDRVLQFYSGTCGSLTPVSPSSCFDPESGTLTGFVGGQTYYVRAYTNASGVNSTFTLCLTVPPVNDNCTGAIAFPTLAPGCTNVTGNSLGATNSGVVSCSGTADDDVWYSFTMPIGYTSLAYSFTNISGDNNRVIEFFNSSCGVGSFSCQTTPVGNLSGLTPGNTYWLRVYTANASPAYSEFTLCLALPPTNDDCVGALPIPTVGALQPGCNTVAASTAASTPTTGVTPAPCTGVADDDVWYTFNIISTTNVGYSITDISGNNDRVIQVFNSCGGTQVYCSTNETGLFGSLTTGTYYVRVFTAGNNVNSDFNLCISLPPSNDNPCNAIALSSPDDACIPVSGTTQLATASQGINGVPAACNGTAEDDVWYSFVATSITHTITVTGSSSFNAAFELYTRSGSCPSATFTAVASSCTNNIATLGSSEALTIRNLSIGTTYFVRVYDAGSSASATPGFTICVVENPTGIPITYYDFELNSNRNGFFETTSEVSVNTSSAFTSPGTISGYPGAALAQGIAGVTINGSCVSVDPSSSGSLTLAPSNYLEVSLNAGGFQTLSLDFDFQSNWSQLLDLDYPWIAVNLSTDGGSTWSNIADFQVPSASTDLWLSPQNPIILPASCNNNNNIKIRFYGYNSLFSAGRIYIDNLTLFAASTVANAGSKTLANFNTIYTGVTSGLTGSIFVYDKFTANGTGSTVNLLNSNIILSNQLNVINSGTFNFGVGSTPRYMLAGGTLGTASFNINTSGTVGVTDASGITTTGSTGNVQCLGTRTYGTDGSYTYFANTAQVTGNGLPASVRNLTVDNTSGVTLSGSSVTVNGVLGLNNGIFRTTSLATDNVIVSSSGNVNLINGWVYGNLQKHITTGGNVIRNFEVGTSTQFTPATITFPSVTSAGNFTVRANPTTFFTGSCLNTTKFLNQVWNITNNSVLPNLYNGILDWGVASSLVGAPTTDNLIVGSYNGSSWNYPALASLPTSTNLSFTGASGNGLFQVAEGAVASVTLAASPSGAQCIGTNITFTATPTNGGTTPNYKFTVNGLQVQNSSSNTYSSPILNNGDVVTVELTSNANCIVYNNIATPVSPITMVINSKPNLSVTNPSAVCSPNTINITNAAIDLNMIPGATFTYFNDSTSAVNQTGALSTLQASAIAINGVYWIRCTTPAGCFEIRPVTATINNCNTLTWEGGFGGIGNESNWNIAANWNPDFVPTALNDIIIPNVANDPILLIATPNAACKDISIAAGATITVQTGKTINVKGNWSGNANVVSGPGKIEFNGANAQSLSGGATFSNLNINNANGVTIPAGVANQVSITEGLALVAGTLTGNGNIKLESSALQTGYIDNFTAGYTGSMTGNITMERFNPGTTGFRYLSMPISNPNITEISEVGLSGPNNAQVIPLSTCSNTSVAGNSPYGNVMEWRENATFLFNCNQSGWHVRSAGNLETHRAYLVRIAQNATVTVTGSPNLTTQTYANNLDFTNPIGNGWHLMGNPYPSPVQWTGVGGFGDMNLFNVTGPFTGNYVAFAPAQNRIIASMQGFFVRRQGAGGLPFSIPNSSRRAIANIQYQNTENWYDHLLDIVVTGNGFADQTTLYFNSNASTNYEEYYDARKMDGREDQPMVFTHLPNGTEQLGVNGLGELNQTYAVPMVVKPGQDGTFTLEFNQLATFPNTAMIYLQDVKEGTLTDLRANPSYTFTASVTDNPERFVILFEPPVQATLVEGTCDTEASLTLTQPGNTVWDSYTLTDNTGNLYAQGTNFTGSVTFNNLAPQEYLFNLTHGSGYTTTEYITLSGVTGVEASLATSANNVNINQVVNFTANTTAPNITWNFGDGTIAEGTTVSHSYANAGQYNVTLTAANNNCSQNLGTTIKVNNVVATNVLTQNAQGLTITGQGEQLVINFNNWTSPLATVTVVNALGQEVAVFSNVETAKNRHEFVLNGIAPAIYFVRVSGKTTTQSQKVFLGKN